MSSYKEYHHFLPSLEVYPRVHYFSKRYRDIKEKYKKFSDKYRKNFSIYLNEAPQKFIENGLTIKVVGNEDLDPAKFVATDPSKFEVLPSSSVGTPADIKHDTVAPVNPYKDRIRQSIEFDKRGTKTSVEDVSETIAKDGVIGAIKNHPTSIVIFNTVVESLDDNGVEDVKLLWKIFENAKEPQAQEVFVLCRSNNEFTHQHQNVFKRKLDSFFGNCLIIPTRIIIKGKTDTYIGDSISLYLEEKIVQNLVTVQSELETFANDKKRCNFPKPVLKDDIITSAVRYFFEGLPAYSEELTESLTQGRSHKNDGSLDEELKDLKLRDDKKRLWKMIKNDEIMIGKLALIVKCSVVLVLSARHNLMVKSCNEMLVKQNFEHRCIGMFSERLVHYVKRLWYYAELQPDDLLQTVAYHRALPVLQHDLFGLVEEIERGIRQFATTLRKLLFEISSCLKKTKVDVGKIKQHAPVTRIKITDSLRKEILRIKEVYGVGTIYGHLEIHINENSAVERVQSLVRDILRKNNVSHPFSVRAIELKLQTLADHSFHEHGERLECGQRTGTLAGFVEGSDQKLYGLTCAHVVKKEEDCDVFIYDASNSRREFAKCVPHMIVSTGTSSKPLIDFAAVRVIDSVKSKCSTFMKNDDCQLYPAILSTDTTEDLAGTYVYKHGAVTQLTKGLVSSDDYSVLNTDESHYLFLIENYDDDGEQFFAMPGDSGSMICTHDENEVYVVKAIGVLNGRKIEPNEEETQKYFSFRLFDGLVQLTQRAKGVQFNFPKC